VCVLTAQMTVYSRTPASILKSIRQAMDVDGSDENTLVPHLGMVLGELCTIVNLRGSKKQEGGPLVKK
jgi:hypothetical protein